MKINGTTIPTPSSLGWGIMSLDSEDSGRTLDGKMHIDKISDKEKLEPSWNGLNIHDTSLILQLVVPNRFVNVTYLSPYTGTEVTKKFYTGDKSSPFYSYTNDNATFTTLSFSFIEE